MSCLTVARNTRRRLYREDISAGTIESICKYREEIESLEEVPGKMSAVIHSQNMKVNGVCKDSYLRLEVRGPQYPTIDLLDVTSLVVNPASGATRRKRPHHKNAPPASADEGPAARPTDEYLAPE